MVSNRIIPAQPEMQTLNELHADLVTWIDGLDAGEPAHLDVDGERPSQPALQLLIATDRALRAKDIAVEHGDGASRILETIIQPKEV